MIRSRIAAVILSLVSLVSAESVLAAPAQLPADCQALIVARFPDWRPTVLSDEVMAWAKTEKTSATVATGDFDGNGKTDWATIGSDGKKDKVILCLNLGAKKALAIADDDGCTNLVYTINAHTQVPNYDSGMPERLPRDSAATSCFEKSGRVFSYGKGKFRVFYHSD